MGVVVFRCDGSEHEMLLTVRDVHLLDGRYFFEGTGWSYRKALGLDYVAGLGVPPTQATLLTQRKGSLVSRLRSLLTALETQKDLISWSYSYEFSAERGQRHGGACSGFRVNGHFGQISVKPSGYCDLTLSELGPNGRGRIIEIADMRVRKQIETDDRGTLSIHRRKTAVGWFKELPRVLSFLDNRAAGDVEILHR